MPDAEDLASFLLLFPESPLVLKRVQVSYLEFLLPSPEFHSAALRPSTNSGGSGCCRANAQVSPFDNPERSRRIRRRQIPRQPRVSFQVTSSMDVAFFNVTARSVFTTKHAVLQPQPYADHVALAAASA